MIKEYHLFFKRVILCVDLSLVLISSFAAYLLRDKILNIIPSLAKAELLPLASLTYYLGLVPILLIIWGALLSYFGMYKSFYMKISESFLIIIKAALTGLILFGSYFFILKMQQHVSRTVIVLTFLLATGLISLEKILLTYAFKVVSKRDMTFKSALIVLRRVLIVGTGQRALNFINLIKKNPGWGIKIIGLIDIEPAKKGMAVGGYEIIGTFEDIQEIVCNNIIDEAVFIVPRSWFNRIEDAMLFFEDQGIKVNLAADIYKLKFSKAKYTDFHGFPLITFENTPERLGHLFLKRVFDFIISFVALIFLSLFFVIISAIIKINSNGPVFYTQLRCGLFGRKFNLYKFRTMVADADSKLNDLLQYNEMQGPVFKMTNDPRITSVGKWLRKYSIDELPQLWNVLKGDMSLVGPRPPIPEEVKNYDNWQRRKLSMRPGITCLWQTSGRSEIKDFNEWLRLDLEYIDNWSLGLDFKILLKTIPAVLSGVGAK